MTPRNNGVARTPTASSLPLPGGLSYSLKQPTELSPLPRRLADVGDATGTWRTKVKVDE